MNLVGIAGRAGAGKSTAASVLVKEFGFVEVALADPIKRICKEVFAFTDEQLWGPSEMRNKPDSRYPTPNWRKEGESFSEAVARREPFLTPRYALQTLGTEWGRGCYEDVWVDQAIRVATHRGLAISDRNRDPETVQADINRGVGYFDYTPQDGLHTTCACCNRPAGGVVIPDVRFPNEVAAIKKAGGVIWLIERPSAGLEGATGAHISEAGVDIGCADHVLSNSGSLEEFHSMVAGVMGFMLKDGRTITAYVPPEAENG